MQIEKVRKFLLTQQTREFEGFQNNTSNTGHHDVGADHEEPAGGGVRPEGHGQVLRALEHGGDEDEHEPGAEEGAGVRAAEPAEGTRARGGRFQGFQLNLSNIMLLLYS